ncbi:MAG: thiamine-phosphate pyrophosphorylase [Candidatus Omnitrophica bacterium]|nr:hypothetical protein [Dehalococcoidales bacterium]MDD5428803.1 thiamine-phosphate pyrophosphorylase [Candidatus Omnitrophota bacterium]
MKNKLYRIIDANLNRSREGLRVCEDIARFALNSKTLTEELKAARHGISDIVKKHSGHLERLSAARNSDDDVLRRSASASEMKRSSLGDIFAANIERVKESLRVLEELFKLIDNKSSSRFCGLRFKVYAIEKKALKRLK